MSTGKRSAFRGAVLVVFFLTAMFTACSHDPNVRKQKYLESGNRYYEKGRYREAAIQYENAIQVDARFADAHYKLALTEIKLGQMPGAAQELIRTLEIQPEYYAAHLDLANLFIAYRQLNDAKEHLDLLTQKQPNNAEVYIAMANYAAANKDMDGALAAIQKPIQLDPNRSDSDLNMPLLQAQGQPWD